MQGIFTFYSTPGTFPKQKPIFIFMIFKGMPNLKIFYIFREREMIIAMSCPVVLQSPSGNLSESIHPVTFQKFWRVK